MGSTKPKKRIGGVQLSNQVSVLKLLSQGVSDMGEPRTFQLHELVSLTGANDEREVQRSLYILEGHKFVSPTPAGDFTSKAWHITKNGLEALKNVDRFQMAL